MPPPVGLPALSLHGLRRSFASLTEWLEIPAGVLRFAYTLEELIDLPGNYHELTNNRKGQWACDLDQPYRMIFKPHESPIPTNNNGQYLWREIKAVEVIEVVNYHQEK